MRRAQQSQPLTDLYESFSKLCLCHVRSYHASQFRLASPLDLTTKSPVKEVKELKEKIMTPEQRREAAAKREKGSKPELTKMTMNPEQRREAAAKPEKGPKPEPTRKTTTPEQRRELALKRVREKQKTDEKQAVAQSQVLGSLAPNSLFADEIENPKRITKLAQRKNEEQTAEDPEGQAYLNGPFSTRNPSNMAVALNPRPSARARWQRRMVIRDIRHRGRITKTMRIARTERSHLSRSHFFKTSMKKLAPLARQIAGKSIDEAITQMRFSKKKAAIDVKEHLITARNEAIVARGMGLPPPTPADPDSSASNVNCAAATASKATDDPSITPPLPTQRADRGLLRAYEVSPGSHEKVIQNQTDIYIAEAWTNRGPYGQEADYRAKGRVNMMRPPYTGLSILLKEEKTRTREKQEKEAKAIRKRMGKNMWTQLPDRPVVRQSQQVLW